MGSARAYLKHNEPEEIIIDEEKHKIEVGTIVSIKIDLDKYHDKDKYDGLSLGNFQNRAENSDYWVNDHYRVLTKDRETEHYQTNHDGIFRPLMDYDYKNHEWSKIGHCSDIKKSDFQKLTKTESHPKGISHDDFCSAMKRFYDVETGRYWEVDKKTEKNLDHIDSHPLVKKFQSYHRKTGNPPHYYSEIMNMGIFEHPNGEKYIVVRNHGFDAEVNSAYQKAHRLKMEERRLNGNYKNHKAERY